MIEIAIAVSAYFLVSYLARRKGFKGPVPGILAAITFPVGVFLSALLFTLASGSSCTENEVYLPQVFENLACAVPVIIGLLLLALITVYFLLCPTRSPLDQISRKTRFPFGVLGLVLVALGALILYNLGTSYFWSFVGFGCFALAAQCFSLQKRRRAKSADEVLALDERQPVLFLRSFSAEARTAVPLPSGGLRPPWSRDRTWEELLVEPFTRQLGPVIALGSPEDYLPQLGSARTYPRDSDWFYAFQSFARRAACILILPGVSGGLLRELRWIRDNLEPARVYLLNPARASSWSDFAATMRDAGFEMPARAPLGGSILGFTNNWCGYYAGRELATDAEYAEAVSHALRHGAGTEFTGTLREREERLQRSKAYALGWLLAATAHKAYSLLRRRRGSREPGKG